MRSVTSALFLIALLAACGSDPVRDAQAELKIVEETGGTSAERCAARRKLQAAYLHARDSQNYAREKSVTELVCFNAGRDGEMLSDAPPAQ